MAEDQKTANQDYFLDEEGNVTTDSEKAATLLIRAGQDISPDMAEKYGNVLTGGKKGTKAGALADEPAADETQNADGGEKASSPSANKKAKPSKNKGAK